MTRIELQVKQEALRTMLAQLDGIAVRCATCRHFEGVSCVKYDATPPADVVKAGCDGWEFDEVPF